MASFLPYKVPYQNQLQFNLGVPITTKNLGVQFQQPRPIVVERISGQHAIPGKISVQHSETPNDSGVNYSILSEDKMSMMSHLARRDLHNGYLQAKMATESQSQSRIPQTFTASRHQRQNCINDARQMKKLTLKETGKNRVFGAVQTPPPRKPTIYYKRDDLGLSARNESVNTTGGSDVYFPVKNFAPDETPVVKDEIIKIQMEISGCLQLLEAVLSRAVSENSLSFLLPSVHCKQKEGFLNVEEDIHRAQTRAEEHKIRCIRTVYNLTQKVKKLQRDIPTADLKNAVRKAQISSQLAAILRSASKAIQVFVSHLPFQKLESGLPPHYCDLAVLLRQLTGLISLTQDGGLPAESRSLESLLNSIDKLNVKWHTQLDQTPALAFKKKSGLSQDWVSDTKVDKNIFATKNKPTFTTITKRPGGQPSGQPGGQPKTKTQHKNQPKSQMRRPGKAASGKENRSTLAVKGTVLQKQQHGAPNKGSNIRQLSAWNLAKNKADMQDERRAWIELAAAKFDKSNSEPSTPSKRKGVNFDLTGHPKTSPFQLRSTNSTPSNFTESPFYVAEVPDRDVREVFPDKQATKAKISQTSISRVGSLHETGKLRSADVSNSFIDEVEHRLLSRLLKQNVASTNNKENSKKLETQKIVSDGNEHTSSFNVGDWSDHEEELIHAEAASLVDAPTLENIKLRLNEMQREQREISERWSSLKFTDVQTRSKRLTSREHAPCNPPAIQVTRTTALDEKHNSRRPEPTAWTEEPLIFTKQDIGHQGRQLAPQVGAKQKVVESKRILTLKQTTVEKIMLERQKYESYLRKRSHHPSGRFDPWKLVEEISDEILDDCLQEVARELEAVNEAIANEMFKSEFMVDKATSDGSLTSPGRHTPVVDNAVTREDFLVSPHQQGWGGGDAPGVNFNPTVSSDSQQHNKFQAEAKFSNQELKPFKYSGESVQLLPDDLSDKVMVNNNAGEVKVNDTGVKDRSSHSDISESRDISPELSLSQLTPNKSETKQDTSGEGDDNGKQNVNDNGAEEDDEEYSDEDFEDVEDDDDDDED